MSLNHRSKVFVVFFAVFLISILIVDVGFAKIIINSDLKQDLTLRIRDLLNTYKNKNVDKGSLEKIKDLDKGDNKQKDALLSSDRIYKKLIKLITGRSLNSEEKISDISKKGGGEATNEPDGSINTEESLNKEVIETAIERITKEICCNSNPDLEKEVIKTAIESINTEIPNTEGGSEETTNEPEGGGSIKIKESLYKDFEKNGYKYIVQAQLPPQITINGNIYDVKELVNYNSDIFGNIISINVKVINQEGNEEEIEINKEQFKENNIEVAVTAALGFKERIRTYATSLRALSTIFDYGEEVFPQLKEWHSDWLAQIEGGLDFLDIFADPAGRICEFLFSGNNQASETGGTKVMSTGGNAALFIDGKKQPVRTTDGDEVYYYRYSFGVGPKAILKPKVINKKIKISVYAKTSTGLIVNLNMDEDEAAERYKTFYEPYFYSNAVYSKKNLKEVCMSYLGSLSDLNDDARRFLSTPFCVDFHEISSEEMRTIDLSDDEEI